MTEHLSEYAGRIQKSQQLSQQGHLVYPATSKRTHHIAEVLTQFTTLDKTAVSINGRLRSWREHGKLTFAHIEDATGTMQVVFSADTLGEFYDQSFKLFDVGDIVEITGTAFLTKRAEQSLLVSELRMLTKALQPLPDKWHGLQDEELRYRERYVDMLMRPELRQLFVQKSIFWNSIRQFLLAENFLEVETPVLESTPGGADAEPFTTHHNALDIDLYLRISMGELWQKRLMVGGFEKTFEIGRQFRNEGISPEHLQDYTQMEFYWAYANYEAGMELVERLYKTCILKTFGKLQFTIHGFDINLDQSWPRIDYTTVVREYTKADILQDSDEVLVQHCNQLQIKLPEEGTNRARLVDALWKYCRKQIAGPVFLMNHPVTVSPLAKRMITNPELVERYQVIIAGSELGNGYTELNDPQDQRSRFEEQAALRAAGDAEAQMHDEDFVRALEYGMPPTTGFGVSERLFSFLVDKPIRECVMFPLLRPKNANTVATPTTSIPHDPNHIIAIQACVQVIAAQCKKQTADITDTLWIEQLAGLILATMRVRPDKDITQVKLSSVQKKFKDKSFAAGVDRVNIEQCAILLGLDIDQAITLCLEGMQTVADQLQFPAK